MEELIKDIVQHGLGKTPMCILGSNHKYFQFECIYSSIDCYKTGGTYSVYEVAPLERFLAKKNKLIHTDILESIYREDESKTMSYIVNWDAQSKIVLLLQMNNPFMKEKQVQETLDIVARNRVQINQLFKQSMGVEFNG